MLSVIFQHFISFFVQEQSRSCNNAYFYHLLQIRISSSTIEDLMRIWENIQVFWIEKNHGSLYNISYQISRTFLEIITY